MSYIVETAIADHLLNPLQSLNNNELALIGEYNSSLTTHISLNRRLQPQHWNKRHSVGRGGSAPRVLKTWQVLAVTVQGCHSLSCFEGGIQCLARNSEPLLGFHMYLR